MKPSRLPVVSRLVFAFSAALVLATPSVVSGVTHEVIVRDFEFAPRTLAIEAGDIVRWVWESGSHTTTSGDVDACVPDGSWDAPIDQANPTFEFQFDGLGVFPYYCIPHCLIDMNGMITVVEAIAEVTVRDFEFDPPLVTINQGDVVRWVWESGSHTTTSGDVDNCVSDGLWNAPMDFQNTVFEFQFVNAGDFSYYCIPHCLVGMNGMVTVNPIVGIEDGGFGPGVDVVLQASRPNPATAQATISYQLAASAAVTLTVHDAAGRLVATLVDAVQAAGGHAIDWEGRAGDGTSVAPGVYFARIESGGVVRSTRIVLVR